MPLEVKELTNEPIIVLSVLPPEGGPTEAAEGGRIVTEFKKKVGKHVYRILDFSVLSEDISFSNLVTAMGAEMGMEGGIGDPEVSSIYVGSSQWVVFGAKAFQEQAQYGQTNVIHICGTVDEAIEFARADIESKKD
jgi:hypothetical protein